MTPVPMTPKDKIEYAKVSARIVANSIEDNAPTPLKHLKYLLFDHPGTPWLFIGIGIEAISIIVGFAIVGVSYPILDAITGIGFGAFILWYQGRYHV